MKEDQVSRKVLEFRVTKSFPASVCVSGQRGELNRKSQHFLTLNLLNANDAISQSDFNISDSVPRDQPYSLRRLRRSRSFERLRTLSIVMASVEGLRDFLGLFPAANFVPIRLQI